MFLVSFFVPSEKYHCTLPACNGTFRMERKSWVKTSLRARVFGNAAGVTARRHSKITSIRLLQLKLFVLKVVSFNQNDKDLLGCYIKQIMNVFHSCNGANMFIRWKLECSIQLGSASLNRTFHLSTHEHIRTIALINIHYVYNILEVEGIPYCWFGNNNNSSTP